MSVFSLAFHGSACAPAVLFAASPGWLATDLAASVFLVLAPLTVVAVLLFRRGLGGTPLAPVFVLFAGFAVCCAVGNVLNGPPRLVAGVFACAMVVALLLYLPRAVAADREVREDLARLRVLEAAVAASGDGVVIAQAEQGEVSPRIVYANAAFERITGYGGDEAFGLSPSVLADETEPAALTAVRKALRGTEPVRVEVPGLRKDGSRVWSEWQVVPVVDDAGKLTHSVAVLRDTTERRRGEQALRESETRFRALFEQAADAIFLLDPIGRIVDANRRACHYLGYTREELTALKLSDLDAGYRSVDLDVGETLTAENWYLRKDGTTVPVEVRFAVLETDERRLKLALVRDVTRRRRAEQALREREEFLRNVITHIPCGVFWKDRKSIFLGCNDKVARDHGLTTPTKIVGKTDFDIGSTPAEANFFRDSDRQVIESGVPILNLEENQTRPDGTKATLLTSKVPLYNSTGEVVGVLGVYQDITDRKRLEEQLRQSQKLEAVGRLAGGIAHDFNNLLTVILGNADLLRNPAPGADDAANLLDEIYGAADRAAALTRQLLTFSRRQPSRPEVVDLNEVVSRLGGMLGRLLGERIAVRTRLAPGQVRVRADRGQLEQVVMNLALNGRDAMPQGGTLTITTERGDDEEPNRRLARLSVSDTGVGMTEEVKAKIFEPFFTTKGPDKGTGLGLSVVHGVVEQASGRIEVETAPGEGSTFCIELPVCPDSVLSSTPITGRSHLGRDPHARGGSVLLVEDEDGVRKLARFVLESQGYAVTEAPDAETGLEMLGETATIDLLVSDVVMPGMGGRDLAVRVRAMRPQVGVVFVSGYVPDSNGLGDVPGAIFLPKPFTPADLLAAANKAMSRLTLGTEPQRAACH